MTERETLKLLQIGVLTNIIPYNMDKMTPIPPPTADAWRFVVTSPENFFFFSNLLTINTLYLSFWSFGSA